MSFLDEKVADSINKNWATMSANFAKITSWIKHGEESPHPLPAKIKAFIDRVTDTEVKLDTLSVDVEALKATITRQSEEIENLRAKLAQSAEPKKISRSTNKSKADTSAKVETAPVVDITDIPDVPDMSTRTVAQQDIDVNDFFVDVQYDEPPQLTESVGTMAEQIGNGTADDSVLKEVDDILSQLGT